MKSKKDQPIHSLHQISFPVSWLFETHGEIPLTVQGFKDSDFMRNLLEKHAINPGLDFEVTKTVGSDYVYVVQRTRSGSYWVKSDVPVPENHAAG